jgi:hypothetical protein
LADTEHDICRALELNDIASVGGTLQQTQIDSLTNSLAHLSVVMLAQLLGNHGWCEE